MEIDDRIELESLPIEILYKIFSYFSGHDAMRLLMASRGFRHVVDERLWKFYCLQYLSSPSTLEDVREWPRVRRLQLEDRDTNRLRFQKRNAHLDASAELREQYESFLVLSDDLDRLVMQDKLMREEILPIARTWEWVFRAITRPLAAAGGGVGFRDLTDSRGKWHSRVCGEWREELPVGDTIMWTEMFLYVGGVEPVPTWQDPAEAPWPGTFRRTGRGRHWSASGQRYAGQYSIGCENGRGRKLCTSGSEYEGHFSMGLEAGFGIHQWSTGGRHAGFWKQGFQEGPGVYLWTSGNFFIGEWASGSHVEGCNVWVDGRMYDGQFEMVEGESVKSGLGKYYFEDGSTYSGSWQNGLRSGFGLMKWEDGSFFEGTWQNDHRSTVTKSNIEGDPVAKKMPFDQYFSEPIELWEKKYRSEVSARERAIAERVREERTRNGFDPNVWPCVEFDFSMFLREEQDEQQLDDTNSDEKMKCEI